MRSLWRLLATALLCLVLATLLLIALALAPLEDSSFWLFGSLGTLGVVLASVAVAARFLDRRPLSEFGLRLDRRWWVDCGFGMFLGAFLMAAAFFIEWSAGWVEIVGTGVSEADPEAGLADLFALVVVFGCVGIYEEIAYRGYLLRNLAEGWNVRSVGPAAALGVSLIATAGFFGITHGMNPNAGAISVGNTALAGVLLGLPYVLTGQLATPIGYHITWNFFQSAVFGLPVSGTRLRGGLMVVEQTGPEWWTGGEYGPEGGVLATLLQLVGILLLLAWVRFRQGNLALATGLAEPPEPPAADGPLPEPTAEDAE